MFARRLALAALCAACLWSCGAEPASEDRSGGRQARAETPEAPSQEQQSHQRMLDRLAEIAAETDATNPWLGDYQVAPLLERLRTLPAGAPAVERWRLLKELGGHELRLGRFEDAIGHLEEAAELAPRLGGVISPEDVRNTWFDLGLAWLRLGETENCVQAVAAGPERQSCIYPIAPSARHRAERGSTEAMKRFRWIAERVPQDLESRWLLHVAAQTLDRPDAVPASLRLPSPLEPQPRHMPAISSGGSRQMAATFPALRDVAPRLGLATLSLSGGAVFDDFDGDGDLDLMWSSFDPRAQMRYFENGAGGPVGTFEDRTEAAGLTGLTGGLNLVQGDYDDDGDLDVLVLRGAWLGEAGRHPNSLLQNQGDGLFVDVTHLAGLADPAYPTQTAGWADYDLDGDLDLYVGNEARPGESYPGQLYRNRGDGTFEEVAEAAGVTNLRYAKGVAWGDFDDDRYPDLYVSNLGEANRLYRNRGDGTFEDVAPRLGVSGPERSFPVWFWDYDDDGRLDLYVSSYWSNASYLAAEALGLDSPAERPRLYRNDGAGGFEDMAGDVGLGGISQPMGANFGDLDGDGGLDLYLGTGFPSYAGVVPNLLYRTVGTGSDRRFENVTAAARVGHLQKGHGVVFADFDNDGDVDLFEQLGGAFPGDPFADVLFENPGFGHRWLQVRLRGRTSHSHGARLRVVWTDGSGRERTTYRWVGSGASFGANPLRMEIGLGDAREIRYLEVMWPATGATQRVDGIALDSRIDVVEVTPGTAESSPPA